MMKQQIIQELKQELHRMEVSSQTHEFDKHVYAMERLLELLKQDSGQVAAPPSAQKQQSIETPGEMNEQDKAMLEMMGGKVDKDNQEQNTHTENRLPAEKINTDDGFGNGDSLFDF